MTDPLSFHVESIGAFSAKPRTMANQLKIERLYREALAGPEDGAAESLRLVASVSAQLHVLLDRCPDGFKLDDAILDDAYKVYSAMRDAEDRFRGRVPAHHEGAGKDSQSDPAVVVP